MTTSSSLHRLSRSLASGRCPLDASSSSLPLLTLGPAGLDPSAALPSGVRLERLAAGRQDRAAREPPRAATKAEALAEAAAFRAKIAAKTAQEAAARTSGGRGADVGARPLSAGTLPAKGAAGSAAAVGSLVHPKAERPGEAASKVAQFRPSTASLSAGASAGFGAGTGTGTGARTAATAATVAISTPAATSTLAAETGAASASGVSSKRASTTAPPAVPASRRLMAPAGEKGGGDPSGAVSSLSSSAPSPRPATLRVSVSLFELLGRFSGGELTVALANCAGPRARVSGRFAVSPFDVRGLDRVSFLPRGEVELSTVYWAASSWFAVATAVWASQSLPRRGKDRPRLATLLGGGAAARALGDAALALGYARVAAQGSAGGWSSVHALAVVARAAIFLRAALEAAGGVRGTATRGGLGPGEARTFGAAVAAQVALDALVVIILHASPASTLGAAAAGRLLRGAARTLEAGCVAVALATLAGAARRLRRHAAAADGKAARALAKLETAKTAYVILVAYLYGSRALAVAARLVLPTRLTWTGAALVELAALLFYVAVGTHVASGALEQRFGVERSASNGSALARLLDAAPVAFGPGGGEGHALPGPGSPVGAAAPLSTPVARTTSIGSSHAGIATATLARHDRESPRAGAGSAAGAAAGGGAATTAAAAAAGRIEGGHPGGGGAVSRESSVVSENARAIEMT